MRLGLLTQWFDPEPGPAALPGVLARGLAERGHEVRVLTGFPNYPTGRIAPGYRVQRRLRERRDGLEITRVALYPSHDDSFARRLLTYASFGASAAVNAGGALRGLDALWVNYSPVTIAAPMWLARYARGVPLVVHVGDLWPDTLQAGGFALADRVGSGPAAAVGRRAAGVAETVLHRWCSAMYASGEFVSYIAPGVRAVLAERGVPEGKLVYAPMWADEAVFAPAGEAERAAGRAWRAELGVAEEAVLLLYAGALGHAQGLDTLVQAVARADDPRLRCVVAGSGTAETELRDLASRLGRQTGREPVTFLGRVPGERMPALMAGADACFVGLRADPLSAVTMPSKTQATMAAGRAIVVSADGDVRDIVREAGAGVGVGSGDVAGLARILVQLCESGREPLAGQGRAGRRFYEATFAVERAVDRAEDLLGRAAAQGPSRPARSAVRSAVRPGRRVG